MMNAVARKERVLLVEDEDVVAKPSIRFLERSGYEVVHAATLEAALDALEPGHDPYDHLLVDLMLGSCDGQDVIGVAEELPYQPTVIVMTGVQNMDARRALSLLGRCAWLPKPVSTEDLLRAMRFQGRLTVAGYGEHHGFSPNEIATLQSAITDLSDDEIAAALGCSASTVRTYWKRMLEKVGVPDRDALRNDVIRWLSRGTGRRPSGVFRARRTISTAPRTGTESAPKNTKVE